MKIWFSTYSIGWILPTFLCFEFLKNGCKNQIQIWHAYKAIEMTPDQYWNEDINAKLDFEICKKLFLVPIRMLLG